MVSLEQLYANDYRRESVTTSLLLETRHNDGLHEFAAPFDEDLG
jgi:hypothetical protein